MFRMIVDVDPHLFSVRQGDAIPEDIIPRRKDRKIKIISWAVQHIMVVIPAILHPGSFKSSRRNGHLIRRSTDDSLEAGEAGDIGKKQSANASCIRPWRK